MTDYSEHGNERRAGFFDQMIYYQLLKKGSAVWNESGFYEGSSKSSWTCGSAPLLCRGRR